MQWLVMAVAVGLFAVRPIYGFWSWFRYLAAKRRMIPLIERQERRRRGLCEHCGYDLRGTQPGRRCPECGTGRAGG